MTPRCPCSSASVVAMACAASVITLNVPIRLTSTTLRKRARSWGPFLDRIRAEGPMPAQLTSTRRGPAAAAASTAAWTCSGSVTSAST